MLHLGAVRFYGWSAAEALGDRANWFGEALPTLWSHRIGGFCFSGFVVLDTWAPVFHRAACERRSWLGLLKKVIRRGHLSTHLLSRGGFASGGSIPPRRIRRVAMWSSGIPGGIGRRDDVVRRDRPGGVSLRARTAELVGFPALCNGARIGEALDPGPRAAATPPPSARRAHLRHGLVSGPAALFFPFYCLPRNRVPRVRHHQNAT